MGFPQFTTEEIESNEARTARQVADLEILSSIRADSILALSSKNTLLSCDETSEPSRLYMLRYHRDRMLVAAKDLDWTEAQKALEGSRGLSRLRDVLHNHLASLSEGDQSLQPLKLRVTLSSRGHVSVTSTQLPLLGQLSLVFVLFPPLLSSLPPPIDHPLAQMSWRVFISPVRVSPSIFTRHKTSERSVYDEARSFITKSPLHAGGADNLPSEILMMNHDDEVMEGSITTPYFWRRGRWVTPPESAGGNIGTTRRYALEAGLCVEDTVTKDSVADCEAIWLSNGARGWGWGKVQMLE